ncbi:aminotransferase class IV [Gammaproteobacteria bacterium]|jgi:D-alanine transaminase|nr:aminotransferase class IV [Gammaproteobacteria bacterium]
MTTVYLNGEFKPLSAASINVLDRGFTFGDGVYEVIPIFNRTIFCFDEHMQRLENSLEAIFMDNPYSSIQWRSIFEELIETIEESEQSMYLQITRGVTERDHDITIAKNPTIFVMPRPIEKKNFSVGINAITHEDIRWQYCDIKAITLLPSVLLRYKANQQGAKEAILIRDGYITEGAASNVFICKNGEVLTPLKDKYVLPGITRDLVVEILANNNITHLETVISEKELLNADEVWITSSTWEIVPVTQLNNLPVGTGETGALWKKVDDLYQEFKSVYCE